MQLSLFKSHEYREFFNYKADASAIIEHSGSSLCLQHNAIVLKIVNDHAIWFFNSADGEDPDVYFWSNRSTKVRIFGKLSEFMGALK